MNWEIEKAKNGLFTLKNRGYYLYSKYDPVKEAKAFIEKETDSTKAIYLLIGLGLGYHLEALLNKSTSQRIYVYCINRSEENLFNEYGNSELLNDERVNIVTMEQIPSIISTDKVQVILPLQWMKVMREDHPLFAVLEDIKTRQMSFSASKVELDRNFHLNIVNGDPSISSWERTSISVGACLISAGPSLNEGIDLLKKIQKDFFVISVGSALKVLLNEFIIPDAVIITDPSPNVMKQIDGTNYKGPLFYLSTANHQMTQLHHFKRFIIYQKGFEAAEIYAKNTKAPLLETGGSVATTALSLLEYMGFQEVYLFGQDLGFREGKTHAEGSTSGVAVSEKSRFRKVKGNNGEFIYTTPNLQAYHRWFEKKLNKRL